MLVPWDVCDLGLQTRHTLAYGALPRRCKEHCWAHVVPRAPTVLSRPNATISCDSKRCHALQLPPNAVCSPSHILHWLPFGRGVLRSSDPREPPGGGNMRERERERKKWGEGRLGQGRGSFVKTRNISIFFFFTWKYTLGDGAIHKMFEHVHCELLLDGLRVDGLK